MTSAIDITDPKLAKAYAHPLRVHILGLLDNRVASPRQIADELGTPLSNTSYHVRQLVSLGLVELVGRTARRGAIEHHYTAKVRPTITDEGWAQLPAIVKRVLAAGSVQQAVRHMVVAAEEGGFDRDDMHFSRTPAKLDRAGWTEVSRVLQEALAQIDQIVADSNARALENPDLETEDSTILMLHFADPSPTTASGRSAPTAESSARDAELAPIKSDL
ncbi:MAG TPA: helix-turn-helix domain-containing protein [Microvirga sp.]|nr:helix-turn-helix domain-containing protein [Microvirga sp.]